MKKVLLLLSFVLTYITFAQGIDSSLYVYDFELSDMSIIERVNFLQQKGFEGVTFRVQNSSHINKLKSYLNTEAVKSGEFSVPIIYIQYEFGRRDELDPIWKEVLSLAPKLPIWVIVRNNDNLATKDRTVDLFKNMCAEAQKSGSNIVIYPHDNTFIESIEDALPYINEVNASNLKLSFHLCHELRAGNGNRLLDVALSALPYLTYATISGSNISVKDNSKDWSDTIKPFDEGDYLVEEFVSVLQKIKFKGKTILHTFGIKNNKNHLDRSLKKWKKMIQSTYQDLNTNLNSILDAPENAY